MAPVPALVRRLAVLVTLVLAVVGACSVPHYDFTHCANGRQDQGETDEDCGGPDCRGCSFGRQCLVDSDCAEGQCLDGFCQRLSCTDNVLDGTETGIDCGGGCKRCPAGEGCNVAEDCDSFVCGDDGLCASPSCSDGVQNGDEAAKDCGGRSCDGCPVGSPCNSAADCITGVCDADTGTCDCAPGTAECDGDPATRCETNLLTSADNCSACGHDCRVPNAVPKCSGGVCHIDSCVAPFGRCNTDDSDGCETNLSNDIKNCGACGTECPALNGTPECVDSECMIGCVEGFADCDGDPATGCETSTMDVQNCGDCGHVCKPPSGETANCAGGVCGSTKCPEKGFGDCNADPSDGCEADFSSDDQNCGRCGNVCTVINGTGRCEAGQCVVKSCDDGYDNCNADDDDGGYSDGCESNLATSAANCGACGTSCKVDNGAGKCTDGTCSIEHCDAPFDNCNAKAKDGGFSDGCETDLTSDAANCGSCGVGCDLPNTNAVCVNSECRTGSCIGSFDDCAPDAPGCETDLDTNPQHCGGCDVQCSTTGVKELVCMGGLCGPPSCDASHANCDGSTAEAYQNGCETPVAADPANCGGCGVVCKVAHSAPNPPCSGGVCVPACDAGWGACGNAANGCTTQLDDATNCGACAPAGTCGGATPDCVASGSAYHCQATVTYVNDVSNSSNGPTLSLTHNLQAGTNRLVLVAIVSRSDASISPGIIQARPDTVTYGGVPMTKFDELGGSQADAANLFYYYLTDTGSAKLPAGAVNGQSVVIDASKHTPAAKVLVADVVEFTGVSQTTPLVTGAKQAYAGNVTISNAVTVGTTGTVVYSLAAAQYVDGTTPTGALKNPALMNLQVSSSAPNLLRAGAAYTASQNPGTTTVGWTWHYGPQVSVHYAILLLPAQST